MPAEIDAVAAQADAAPDRGAGAEEGAATAASKARLAGGRSARSPSSRSESDAMRAQWQRREGDHRADPQATARARDVAAARRRRRSGRATSARRRRSCTARSPSWRRSIEELRRQLAKVQEKHSYLSEEVTDEDIAGIVAKWTGIPVTKMVAGRDARSCSRWRSDSSTRVVGQDAAVAPVAERGAPRRARACGIRTARSGAFSFSVRRAWARRSWRARSPSSSSTTSGR